MYRKLLTSLFFNAIVTVGYAQVGIGTTMPTAFLNVPAGKTVLFGKDSTSISAGKKMIWYGSLGAFRAGEVYYDAWNYANVGQHSFSAGLNANASGETSVALGRGSQASGSAATALGESTNASGNASTAMGFYAKSSAIGATAIGVYTTASGQNAIALGANTTASGVGSTATGGSSVASGLYATATGSSSAKGSYAISMGNSEASGDYALAAGYQTIASGNNSTALGNQTVASSLNAIAMGYKTMASGFFSTAMGSFVNAAAWGSFIIGDNYGGSTLKTTAENQMMMRFANGYRLYTNGDCTVGVFLNSGDNAWQTLSDSTRKENFRNVEGASFLQKIARMRLGSWNYKGQDAKMYRHYGPMAQDFYAAFGRDELGTIGEDKSINQADFDGVNLIAIQALIKKVEKLEAENAVLKQQVTETASLKSDIEQIKKQLTTLLKQ